MVLRLGNEHWNDGRRVLLLSGLLYASLLMPDTVRPTCVSRCHLRTTAHAAFPVVWGALWVTGSQSHPGALALPLLLSSGVTAGSSPWSLSHPKVTSQPWALHTSPHGLASFSPSNRKADNGFPAWPLLIVLPHYLAGEGKAFTSNQEIQPCPLSALCPGPLSHLIGLLPWLSSCKGGVRKSLWVSFSYYLSGLRGCFSAAELWLHQSTLFLWISTTATKRESGLWRQQTHSLDLKKEYFKMMIV